MTDTIKRAAAHVDAGKKLLADAEELLRRDLDATQRAELEVRMLVVRKSLGRLGVSVAKWRTR
jgi:hypothetical protein